MRIQRTSQILTFVIIFLSVLAVVCTCWAWHLRVVEGEAYEARRKMFNFTDQLAGGSDRLTATVRAYAATSDRRHYQSFQRQLGRLRGKPLLKNPATFGDRLHY